MTRRLSVVLLSTLLLGACASWIDTPFQEITLKTPGTDNARCTLDNDINKWMVHSNQTIKIQRNDADLKLECYAPGDKYVSTVIDRDLNAWTIANITNGVVPGVSYDHFTGALYDYPKTITVDFSSVPGGYPLPQYHGVGMQNPDDQNAETWGPEAMKGADRQGQPPRKMDMGEIRSRSNPLGDARSSGAASRSTGNSVEIYNP